FVVRLSSPIMAATVGITANPSRPAALECAAELAERLAARGVEVRLQKTLAVRLAAPPAADADLGRGSLLVAVGGDGTLLAASRLAAPHGTPILGVHVGGPASFGFMTETSPATADAALERALAGEYEIDERMMVAS